MSKNKPPAFQWYPKDILTSLRVSQLSLAEEGAYRRALDYCWLHETLPANTKELAAIIGKGCSVKIAERVAAMFLKDGEVLRHDRLDEERQKQSDFSAKQAQNGKKGGRPKRITETQTKPTANPNETQPITQTEAKKSSSSASPSSSPLFIKIREKKIEKKPSEWLNENMSTRIEQFLMKLPKIDLKAILERLDAEYIQHTFSDENHVFNAFKSVTKALITENAKKPVQTQYKQLD